MRIENSGIHARESVHVRIAHREDQARHASLVEPEHAKPLGADEREPASLRDDELEIANLCFEVLQVDPDERRVRPDERGRRNDETAPREILANAAKAVGDS